MVRLASTFVALASALGLAHADTVDVSSLAVGDYYRPTGTDVVSGYPGATTPYRRSPCPGLNTLANHGYLPRDGKNITLETVLAAVQDYYNLADDVLSLIASLTPDVFDLNTLSNHTDPGIEHDASLSRIDTYFGGDESLIAENRTTALLDRGADGTIDVTDLAKARAELVAWSEEYNPEFNWGSTPQFLAGAESGFVLRIMGGNNSEVADTEYVRSFFIDEKLPTGWSKPSTQVTYSDLTTTIASLAAVDTSSSASA